MSFAYPVMLDVTGRIAVIVGGGAVAVRKAKALLAAGAGPVRVVSPDVRPDLPAEVERVSERYAARHLDGAFLAFAATNDRAVNDAVVRDAAARGILANRADADPDLPGDFATPALLRRGPVTVAVSSGSAALTAAVRDGLAGRWDDRWTAAAEAMRDLRPLVVNHPGLPPARRTEVLRALASEDALARLDTGGVEGLR
ncbi:MAG: bifunctional precorrin-2 dehydrogenase/sirohydrochlorin ferrochelatase, partial [Phycisphaerales bacterium]|nr:bifunctional precorrin-2 dehydrogenase/sirohydrochlorin ferrochelatase [Phycisphaerales bacterium]